MNSPRRQFLPLAAWVPLTALIALMAVSVCEARTKKVDDWRNPDVPKYTKETKPEKVAVITVLPDALAREAVEIDIAKKLTKGSRIVYAGSKLPGLNGGIRGKINTEVATKALQAAGMDGVIVLFYAGGGIKDSYQRSNYWLKHEGTAMGAGYYNWGQPYFVDVYSVQQGESYSDYTTVNLVESTYFDLKTEKPVWRIVTETTDREHSDPAIEIAKKIASEMNSAGL